MRNDYSPNNTITQEEEHQRKLDALIKEANPPLEELIKESLMSELPKS